MDSLQVGKNLTMSSVTISLSPYFGIDFLFFNCGVQRYSVLKLWKIEHACTVILCNQSCLMSLASYRI